MTAARDRSLARPLLVAFAAVLGFWLVYPLLLDKGAAQDTVPYVAAGELAHSDPSALYPGDAGVFDFAPEFRARSCAYYESQARCDAVAGPYVSPPPALPIAVVLSWTGDASTILIRELGVVCLVATMAIAWHALADRGDGAKVALVLTAAALTPLVKQPIDLGQTSPLLFLAAVVPLLGIERRRWQDALGVLLGVAIAIKSFPAAVLVVPLVTGRRRVLWVSIGVLVGLSAVALALSGGAVWHRYVEVSSAFTDYARDDANGGAIEKALDEIGLGSAALALLVRAAVVGLVALVFWLRRDFLARWAVMWPAILLVLPHVLGHYLFASIGGVAVAIAAGDRERWRVWALPAAALITLPVALSSATTDHTSAVLFGTNAALLALTTVVLLRTRIEPALERELVAT